MSKDTGPVSKMPQSRDRSNGRYSFDGDMSKLCVCGHPLGVHAAEAPHDCFNGDKHVPDATGEKCACQKFRLSRKKKMVVMRKAQPPTNYDIAKAADTALNCLEAKLRSSSSMRRDAGDEFRFAAKVVGKIKSDPGVMRALARALK